MLTADDDGDDDVRGDGDGDDGDDGGADVDGHRSLNNADACEKSNALAEKQHWLWNLVIMMMIMVIVVMIGCCTDQVIVLSWVGSTVRVFTTGNQRAAGVSLHQQHRQNRL